MRRRLFTLASAVSLLLCVATAALWVRSYVVWDIVMFDFTDEPLGRRRASVQSSRGAMSLGYVDLVSDSLPGLKWIAGDPWSLRPRPGWRTFAFDQWEGQSGGWSWNAYFPHWLPALLFAALPAMWLIQWRRQRRRDRVGLCPACGYDLRATPDRCPECGAESTQHEPVRRPV